MGYMENSVTKNSDFSEQDSLYKSIGDVSAEIGIPPHVLRFWESKFLNIKPHKRKGGHRYYSIIDIKAIYEIKRLLYEEGYTIKGAQRFLKDKGYMQSAEISEGQQSLFTEESKVKPKIKGNLDQPDLLSTVQKSVDLIDPKAVKLLLEELESIKTILGTVS